MSFLNVYKALEEIFPEIDSRVLKAVALENKDDVDAAVEVVLTKVMPCINARSRSSSTSSPSPSKTNVQSPNGSTMDTSETRGQQNVALKKPTSLDEEQLGQFDDAPLKLLDPETPEINLLPLERLNSGQSSICSDESKSEVMNLEGQNSDSLKPCSPEGNDVHIVAITNEVPNSDPYSLKSVSGELDLLGVDNLSTINVDLSKPVQICSVDVLEDHIALERNRKKTLFTALESVINLMKEVEFEEKNTEEAKKEAAMGGLDTLQKVEDLKKMLHHAKEANEMHAGEVNGEKAILVTEVKELQTRLSTLSDETDKSLGILNEMHQSLEARLVVVNKERENAEKEKLKKEAIAKKAFDDQEVIMEKVVNESKILKEQADENAKLREFLVERGHVVDSLQGEISVICKDVILLKQQFDEHLPLSKSLTSSQTSCILASSNSSLINVEPVLVDPVNNNSSFEEDNGKTKGLSSSWGSSNAAELATSETEAAIDNHKEEVSDEGWEIC